MRALCGLAQLLLPQSAGELLWRALQVHPQVDAWAALGLQAVAASLSMPLLARMF